MAKKKSNSGLWITLGIIGVLVLVVVIIAATKGNNNETIVQTSKVTTKTIKQMVSATGRVQPETAVKISPETSGEITFIGVTEGDAVSKNQLLIRIKPDIIQTQLEQYKAGVVSSQKDIDMAKTNMKQLERDLARMKELFDKKYISSQEYDKYQSQYEQAKSSYESATSRYDQANAMYRKVQRDAERTILYAPIAGVVTKLNVELGEKVVGTSMMAGTEILVVSDLNVMNAVVDVDENDITMVNIGDMAEVQIDAFPDEVFKGTVIEIGHSANLTSLGTQDQVTNFSVKIRLLNNEIKMRPGMSCNADIITKVRANVKAVPLQSVTVRNFTGVDRNPDLDKSEGRINKENTGNNKSSKPPSVVFINKKGKAKMVSVETGISDKGYIEIISGLGEGDEVISGPFSAVSRTLKNGDVVKVEKLKKPNFKK